MRLHKFKKTAVHKRVFKTFSSYLGSKIVILKPRTMPHHNAFTVDIKHQTLSVMTLVTWLCEKRGSPLISGTSEFVPLFFET